MRVEAHAFDVQAGDRLLLCSDGLTELVPETAIARILQAHEDPGEAAEALVAEANERGGLDNVTCVLVRWSP